MGLHKPRLFKPGGYTAQDFKDGFDWEQLHGTKEAEKIPIMALAPPAITAVPPTILRTPTSIIAEETCEACGTPLGDRTRYQEHLRRKRVDEKYNFNHLLSGRGFVYFVQYGGPEGLIKIGRARNMHERFGSLVGMSAIQPLTLLGCIHGEKKERKLHSRFRQHHEHHEFFRPHPELLDYIKKHATKP